MAKRLTTVKLPVRVRVRRASTASAKPSDLRRCESTMAAFPCLLPSIDNACGASTKMSEALRGVQQEGPRGSNVASALPRAPDGYLKGATRGDASSCQAATTGQCRGRPQTGGACLRGNPGTRSHSARGCPRSLPAPRSGHALPSSCGHGRDTGAKWAGRPRASSVRGWRASPP